MTIPRYQVLHAYWASRPPVHVTQAVRFIKQSQPRTQGNSEEFEAAVRAMNGA